MSVRILVGDVREKLAELPDESVDCVVTSPPYWGLRDYGVEGQLGMECTLGEHLATMVEVFDAVRRVMKPEGVVFLNYGDCYASSPNGRSAADTKAAGNDDRTFRDKPFSTVGPIFDARHAEEYGSGGKGRPDFPDRGWTFRNHSDGHKGSRKNRSPGSDFRLALEQAAESLTRIREHMATLSVHLPISDCAVLTAPLLSADAILDCAHEAQRSLDMLHDALASTKIGSSKLPPEGYLPLDMISACRASLSTFSLCVRRFVRKLGDGQETLNYMEDIASLREELDQSIQCTDGFCSLLASWRDDKPQRNTFPMLKPKDLCMIPNRLAIALQDDGWWVRSEIIWGKPNPMPDSSGRYRPSTAHEKLWLLSKSAKSYYDSEAVRMPATEASIVRWAQNVERQRESDRAHAGGKANGLMKAVGGDKQRGHSRRHQGFNDRWDAMTKAEQQANGRLLRNYEPDLSAIVPPEVWEIATAAFSEAHFATFPPALVAPCIMAGCPKGGVVLDPFFGAGTTGLVADRLQRDCIGIELNPDYAEIARRRINGDVGALFGSAAA